MPDLPTGTVTFLFTDIEGSTLLLQQLDDRYREVVDRHAQILRDAIIGGGGTEVGTEGDSFFAVFPLPAGALEAVIHAQRALAAEDWPDRQSVRARMGLHTGQGVLGGDDYIGLDVHRAARIAAAGHGGQVLLSESTRALVAHDLQPGVGLRDLGDHRLKDLPAPERIWQLEVDGLPRDFPALRSLDGRPNNLPVPATLLIGREDEMAGISQLLQRQRLITLTGPGGIGKSRLALAVAQRLMADYEDGAFFVALEDARDRPSVAAAIASALGVREKPDRDLEQGVKEHLRQRELLLVLDNFEQLVTTAAPLVAELLSVSPRSRIVVTSRAALHLSGEQEFSVPPLSIPDPKLLPVLAGLPQYEAVGLFIDRARAVMPDFALTDENALAVASICNRLDGLPLAIELAAARIKIISPEEILDRLERHLPVLASGASDLPARQRTLGSTIDWSYELLEPAERRLFVRLAAFAGGWTVESADAVCNPEGELDIDSLDGLASLVDKSLIHVVSSGEGESRFAMLQVIREFAAEKLAAETDADEVRGRHARHMLALAESAEPELRRSDLRRWQQRLRREEENLRTALRWAGAGGEVETGLRTAGAIWDFWHYWAEVREGVGWLESLLALPAAAAPDLARAKALRGLAGLLYWQGDADRAWDLYEDALLIYRRVGDDQVIAEALLNSAWAAAGRHDFASGKELANEALELYRQLGDTARAGLVETWLVLVPFIMGQGGDVNAAVDAASRAFDVSSELGQTHDATNWLDARALIHLRAGDHRRGIQATRKALAGWYDLGNMGRLPLCFKLLAALELVAGRPERAVRLGAITERYTEEIGGDLAWVFGQLGDVVEQARPLLDPKEHARAVEEARAMSPEEQIAYALQAESSPESTVA